ncbi:hypothetical protein G159_19940 [Planococcus glaciei CHR43]|nr:hypothetical protein G159_19940 [Planococcus glaciei CHR43]
MTEGGYQHEQNHFALRPDMRGGAVADLQEALRLLLDRGAILRDDEGAPGGNSPPVWSANNPPRPMAERLANWSTSSRRLITSK